MYRFLIATATLFCFINCHSQNTYKGRLISSLTGKPVRSGYIELNNKLIASCDTSGYFTIDLDSSNNISFLVFSSQTGWIPVSNLNFKQNEILSIHIKADCLYSSKKDISERKVKLLIPLSGFSPPLTENDHIFESRYKLIYLGYGSDEGGIVTDCIETYNYSIGQYLDKKYGKGWRKEVNKGVIGL